MAEDIQGPFGLEHGQTIMSQGNQSNFIAHSLLRARDWQHRPQLDQVRDWWHDGGRGVCALIGMGGAGKTAVAERFLRTLPGGLPEDPDIPKDPSLPAPNSTFVFSFYDAPNAEAFFESLQMWLQNTPVETVLSFTALGFMLQQRQGLIVLDGLERVQNDGQRGEFGRLNSPSLRDFLNQLASGNFSDLSVLVTSRFPLADLRDKNPRFFHPIPVNQIDLAAGVQLLRDRGVHGTDLQLEPIVEQCGGHALTVDFAGGYIAEYGQGDPATPLNLSVGVHPLGDNGEDELDEDQRDVLRQGHRFARIAEHYRDAMLQRDEAVMALLERICLFRLGVDSQTLAAIFTGEQAIEVSGTALAALSPEQLQSKLDWLVRMRIVEQSESSALKTENRKLKTLFSIHPAVRDGFLSGISRDAAQAGHEAVRKGLEVSLGDAPGENPSDPATLDLLEEIVHHTLQSGHVREAWDIHRNRIGGYENLGWRLGAYERGERICRAFAGGQSPETLFRSETRQEFRRNAVEGMNAESLDDFRDDDNAASRRLPTDGDAQEPRASALRRMPFLDLPEATRSIFIGTWALYLTNLGRLAAAARCYELVIEMEMQREDWKNASITNRNLCDVWLLSGRLSRLPKDEGGPTAAVGRRKDETDESLPPSSFGARPSEASPATSARLGASSAGALATADEALRLAGLADDAWMRCTSHGYRAHVRSLRGEVPAALTDFNASLEWQQKDYGDEYPLVSGRGVRHTQLLTILGRHEEATRLTTANQKNLLRNWGPEDNDVPKCQLVLSSLSIERPGSPPLAAASFADLWAQARDWALARDAKEVLCWSYLVETQHALARLSDDLAQRRGDAEDRDHESVTLRLRASARDSIRNGLKIARDCGYGLFHIDLLLERARLHLLRGDAGAALDDLEVALDKGMPADDENGQPELLAARHEACGYAWAIPVGLQLRAEALLLKAAQETKSDSFAPAKLIEFPAEILSWVAQAKELLREALELWQPLHDPEPERDDQNFKLDGQEYNYKAAETHRILVELEGGVLTRYPLVPLPVVEKPDEDEQTDQEPKKNKPMTKKHVFLSYCQDNQSEVSRLRDDLIAAGEPVWWDQDILAGQDWKMEIRQAMRDAYAVVVCFSKETDDRDTSGIYPEVLDAITAYREFAPGGIFLIPVRLSACEIPLIEIDGTRTLDRLNYVDLFEPGGFDKLVQSIQASTLHP